MDLPLHEQLLLEKWRRLIDQAGPGDLQSLKTISLKILDYAASQRQFALAQAAALLPRQNDQVSNSSS